MGVDRQLAVPFLVAVLAAGCGNGGPSADTGSPKAELVAYSACMRAHGVPNFPDPNSKGNLIVDPASGIDPNAPQYRRADQVCAKLRTAAAGTGMTPAEQARALARVTRYAQCMRRHGIPMPNPFTGPNGGVGYALPRGIDLSSPAYEQADRACRRLLPPGG